MNNLLGAVYRLYKFRYLTPVAKESEGVLRIGLLGAANIAPPALIWPAVNHPEVVISAVACRDKKKGETFASKHSIAKVFHGPSAYQELIDDPSIDAVYNALPNGLHFEWTMKALKQGKHVLLEKPSCSNSEETKQAFAYAEEKGLVVLEAFHPRFHPVIARFKEIINSGELGKIKSTTANFRLGNLFPNDDIRFDYSLAGGTLMDMGAYALTLTRAVLGREPVKVTEAHSTPFSTDTSSDKSKIDLRTTATLQFPDDIIATIDAEHNKPRWGPFGLIPPKPEIYLTCYLEGGEVQLNNFFGAVWHSLTVTPKNVKQRTEYAYAYKGAPKEQGTWSTYRYQLEAFVDKVKGREPRAWVSGEDSVKNMEAIDMVYEKTGLGARVSRKFDFEK